MDRAVDILHPLASLEWKKCRGPPIDVRGARDAQAVWLKDKVYMGGGETLGIDARLYIYTPATDTWTTLDTPVYYFGLTAYHSQLVLIGGWEYVDDNNHEPPTDKLWTLSEHGQWQETLPCLPKPCGTRASAVSHGDHLLVISSDYPNNKVYVYNGHHWASAQHPPHWLLSVKSTVYDGHWYLMGAEQLPSLVDTYTFRPVVETCVYSASLDSLLASCQPSDTSQSPSVWKRLACIPTGYYYPAVFRNRLVAVGVRLPLTITICVYSSLTESWIHAGNVSISISGSNPCAVALPSSELMVVRGDKAFKVALKMTPFNPDNSFNMRAVSLLEAAGIPVIRTLKSYTRHIQYILGLTAIPYLQLSTLLSIWISSAVQLQVHPPTWKNLLLIIRLLKLNELAQRIETYLSGGTEEVSPTRGKQGGGEVDEQIQLRDDVIFRLKQQTSTQQQRIEELKDEIEALRSQVPIKKEREDETEASVPFPIKVETKEELEHEEKPIVPFPVKIEPKEESVTVTKAETMSAQPITATWTLRGVEVCGEMTVVVYSSHDQQITWPGYGLRLHIPKGCLPAGMEQCTISIKASLAGQYEFPENSHLVSAVFWLRCKDVYEFVRPITVEVQHCSKSENATSLNLTFVRAVCSQKQLPYTFKQLPGGNFTSHSSYGVIELNGFSGLGVTQEGSEDREYCSRLFYMPVTRKIPNQEIDFVVSWNTEAHLTAIEVKYIKRGAIPGPHQPVEFEADMIALDIPMEGITIKGWKITPLIRPVVTKKQVDNFREGKLTPCCQLKAQVVGRRKKIPYMSHQVTLQGAKYPHNIFTIDLPAEDTNSQPAQTFGDLTTAGPPPKKQSRLEDTDSTKHSVAGASTAGPPLASGLDTKLNLSSDHYKVASYLRKLDDRQIRYVGGALGLAYNTLDKMRDVPSEMAAAWLRREDYVVAASGEPTWRTLINALRKERQEGTATDIEKTEK